MKNTLTTEIRETLIDFMRTPIEDYSSLYYKYYEEGTINDEDLENHLISWNSSSFSDAHAHRNIPPLYYYKIIKIANSLKKSEAEVTEEFFWNVIEKLNYSSDLDYERVGVELSNNSVCSKSQALKIVDINNHLYNKLEASMDSYIEEEMLDYDDLIGLGDDGLNDLLSHIIGLGKTEYYECLNNIQKLSSHALGKFDTVEGYTESFNYAFQSLDND